MGHFLVPWYDFIATHDWPTALRGEFSNYTPPYIYLITLVATAPGEAETSRGR
jgi:hypothetical protein